ncbi:hypothetical protein HDU92_005670 [Lobulomyces angularis]|nr:hypothetical protein HDU92_005670 [Lobulomyces angularis]
MDRASSPLRDFSGNMLLVGIQAALKRMVPKRTTCGIYGVLLLHPLQPNNAIPPHQFLSALSEQQILDRSKLGGFLYVPIADPSAKTRRNNNFQPFADLNNAEELERTWKICTKAKDALENGNRLENLSWRLWHRHQTMSRTTPNKFRKLSEKTTVKLENEKIGAKGKESESPVVQVISSGFQRESYSPLLVPTESQQNRASPVIIKAPSKPLQHKTTRKKKIQPPKKKSSQINSTQPSSLNIFETLQQRSPTNSVASNTYLSPELQAKLVQSKIEQTNFFNQTDDAKLMSFLSEIPFSDDIFPFINENEISSTQEQQANNYISAAPSNCNVAAENLDFLNSWGGNSQYLQPPTPQFSSKSLSNSTYLSQFSWPGDSLILPNVFAQNQFDDLTPSDPQTCFSTNLHQMQQQEHRSTDFFTSKENSSSGSKAPKQKQTSVKTVAPATSSVKIQNPSHPAGLEHLNSQCQNCGVNHTPLWRRSSNDELLCNACGLYFKMHSFHRAKPKNPIPQPSKDSNGETIVSCFNCSTKNTPLWRRDGAGNMLCNACGLYLKLHNEHRPLSLKTDTIRKRQRYASFDPDTGESISSKKSKKQNVNNPPPTGATITGLFNEYNQQ